jgi:bifunctional DNA-binding transcriptional regulator/antitoxin component of YhaV-PrlF toxin-antitoxin module
MLISLFYDDGSRVLTVLPRPLSAFLYYLRAKVKGMPKVSSKNQVTIPVEAMRAAGLYVGDEITVRSVGDGEIVLASKRSRIRRHAGIATGIYKTGELDRLRDEWTR